MLGDHSKKATELTTQILADFQVFYAQKTVLDELQSALVDPLQNLQRDALAAAGRGVGAPAQERGAEAYVSITPSLGPTSRVIVACVSSELDADWSQYTSYELTAVRLDPRRSVCGTVTSRYSELAALKDDLKNRLKHDFAGFPKKTSWGRDLDPASVASRRDAFDQWLASACADRAVSADPQFLDYFGIGKAGKEGDSARAAYFKRFRSAADKAAEKHGSDLPDRAESRDSEVFILQLLINEVLRRSFDGDISEAAAKVPTVTGRGTLRGVVSKTLHKSVAATAKAAVLSGWGGLKPQMAVLEAGIKSAVGGVAGPAQPLVAAAAAKIVAAVEKKLGKKKSKEGGVTEELELPTLEGAASEDADDAASPAASTGTRSSAADAAGGATPTQSAAPKEKQAKFSMAQRVAEMECFDWTVLAAGLEQQVADGRALPALQELRRTVAESLGAGARGGAAERLARLLRFDTELVKDLPGDLAILRDDFEPRAERLAKVMAGTLVGVLDSVLASMCEVASCLDANRSEVEDELVKVFENALLAAASELALRLQALLAQARAVLCTNGHISVRETGSSRTDDIVAQARAAVPHCSDWKGNISREAAEPFLDALEKLAAFGCTALARLRVKAMTRSVGESTEVAALRRRTAAAAGPVFNELFNTALPVLVQAWCKCHVTVLTDILVELAGAEVDASCEAVVEIMPEMVRKHVDKKVLCGKLAQGALNQVSSKLLQKATDASTAAVVRLLKNPAELIQRD